MTPTPDKQQQLAELRARLRLCVAAGLKTSAKALRAKIKRLTKPSSIA